MVVEGHHPTVTSSRGFRRPVVAVVLTLLISGACSDSGITDVVMVVNNTPEVLHFEIVTVDGTAFGLNTTARPGETVPLLDGSQLSDGAGLMRDRCTVGELRALAADGHIVDRLPPPICANTTVVLGQGGSPS